MTREYFREYLGDWPTPYPEIWGELHRRNAEQVAEGIRRRARRVDAQSRPIYLGSIWRCEGSEDLMITGLAVQDTLAGYWLKSRREDTIRGSDFTNFWWVRDPPHLIEVGSVWDFENIGEYMVADLDHCRGNEARVLLRDVRTGSEIGVKVPELLRGGRYISGPVLSNCPKQAEPEPRFLSNLRKRRAEPEAVAKTEIVYGLSPHTRCGCGAPATVGRFCVYCAHSTAQGARGRLEQDALTAAETQTTPDELAAKQRLDADERRQKKPRPLTAEERELAKSHPWEGDEP